MARSTEAASVARRPGALGSRYGARPLALAALLSLLLGGCHDEHPLYGPSTPRDGNGTAVDPVYGTPLPGAPQGNHGM
jgi:hypothetical protein